MDRNYESRFAGNPTGVNISRSIISRDHSVKFSFNVGDVVPFMCAVSNNDYYLLKNRILEIDPSAFIVIDKCYEVNGGVKRSNIPFL